MDAGPQAATATQSASASASASASPAAAEAFAIFPCIIVMPLPSWPTEVGGLAMLYYLEWTLGKGMQHHHEGARTGPPKVLRAVRILVVNSWSCGEAEFQACQVAGSLPV